MLQFRCTRCDNELSWMEKLALLPLRVVKGKWASYNICGKCYQIIVDRFPTLVTSNKGVFNTDKYGDLIDSLYLASSSLEMAGFRHYSVIVEDVVGKVMEDIETIKITTRVKRI